MMEYKETNSKKQITRNKLIRRVGAKSEGGNSKSEENTKIKSQKTNKIQILNSKSEADATINHK